MQLVQVRVPASSHRSTTLETIKDTPRTVYIINTTEMFSVIAPYKEPQERTFLQRVAVQARHHNCLWAANGGPFHRDGSAAGALLMNGKVVNDDFGGAVGFGVAGGRDGARWVLGALESKEQALQLGLVDYVTGFNWLVYDGENVADVPSNFTPQIARAPRTAVGVDRMGNLIIIVADGCERCISRRGLTLSETADILVRRRLTYAVNMDGGSSSTLTQKYKVINRPTCLDFAGIPCSRAVASVLCINAR